MVVVAVLFIDDFLCELYALARLDYVCPPLNLCLIVLLEELVVK